MSTSITWTDTYDVASEGKAPGGAGFVSVQKGVASVRGSSIMTVTTTIESLIDEADLFNLLLTGAMDDTLVKQDGSGTIYAGSSRQQYIQRLVDRLQLARTEERRQAVMRNLLIDGCFRATGGRNAGDNVVPYSRREGLIGNLGVGFSYYNMRWAVNAGYVTITEFSDSFVTFGAQAFPGAIFEGDWMIRILAPLQPGSPAAG